MIGIFWLQVLLILSLGLFAIKLHTLFNVKGRKVPGPYLASLSSLYRVYLLWSGDCTEKYESLHKNYGPVVRTGPHHVIVSDQAAICRIYDAGGWRFPKSDFYRVFALTFDGKIRDTVFSTRDAEYHRMMQSHTVGRFAPGMLAASKTAIEKCVFTFVRRMKEFEGQRIDLAVWTKYWAFDTNSTLNFGRDFGFMAQGKDIKGIIQGNDQGFHVGALIGQVPWLNAFFLENKKLMRFLSLTAGVTDPTADFVELIREKVSEAESHEQSDLCLLTWLRSEQNNPKKADLDDETLIIHLANYFVAGSVTVATSIGAILYYAIQTPQVYEKLVAEVRKGDEESETTASIGYANIQRMPYLQAVIKEAMRLAPTNNLPLERIVPEEGFEVGGLDLPAGTIVGTSAYMVHHDRNIYGMDAGEFRPERWLDADVPELKKMQSHFFAFGRGERGCSGRTLAMMMMSVFVVQVLRVFDVEWASEKETWDLKTWWMPEQRGLIVRFKSHIAG